ncbi:MAG: hypothetical protein KF803_05650 [Cyclobacteriaceae bacterium]|nr:hypothetical protein [Cyclobacteriaceae bacterium]
MRLAFVSLTILVILAGCTKHQFISIQTSALPEDRYGAFFHENDSLKITYKFWGHGGSVQVEILNKLEKPVFIDWSNSAIISNGRSLSMWKNQSRLDADSDGFQIRWSETFSSTSSQISGVISGDSRVSMAPPQSVVVAPKFSLRNTFFPLPDPLPVNRVKETNEGQPIRGFKYNFDRTTTPLSFRIYLAVRFTESGDPVYFDTEFWVQEILQTQLKPEEYYKKRQKQFYITEMTDGGKAGFILAGSAILVGYAALKVQE